MFHLQITTNYRNDERENYGREEVGKWYNNNDREKNILHTIIMANGLINSS